MEVENKLDEDFIFYITFTKSYINRLKGDDLERANAWLDKLVGQTYNGIDMKRNRNIYLSNLIICMQEGKLTMAFHQAPNVTDISNAQEIFGPPQPEVKEPEWLQQIQFGTGEDFTPNRPDGRTYLATRTLPDGQGAFGYVAITMDDREPRWLGGGEGVFEEHMQMKYEEYVPPIYEMEKILARRKDPKERERVITFYNALLQNISDELDGAIPAVQNEDVNEFLSQLVNDLRKKNKFDDYALLAPRQQRVELLILLYDRLMNRRDKVIKREEILDELENQTLPSSFFEISREEQDKFELPAAMWEQAINKAPNKKNLNLLQSLYPIGLVDKFVQLLSNHKEEIAIRLQKRHENIVSQMKKELRKEGEAGRKLLDEAQVTSDEAVAMLNAVKAARDKQQAHFDKIKAKKDAAKSETTKMYEALRDALYDTQRSVEEEAERGRHLASQINAVNLQTEVYHQVTDDSIKKTEEANINLMQNIKRLRMNIQQHEKRLLQLRSSKSEKPKGRGGQQLFFFD